MVMVKVEQDVDQPGLGLLPGMLHRELTLALTNQHSRAFAERCVPW